jgi:hypothetical protein
MSDKPPIVFISGRMNPPTPGHMLILEKAIEEGNKMGAKIKIYLTSTHNNLIGKYGKNKYIYPIEPIKGFKEDNINKKNGYVGVKDKKYQNPLTPQQKKDFVELMLKNKFSSDKLKHVEIFIDHTPEKDCNGVLRARLCALAEQNDPNKVFFVMGRETDEKEREKRETYCGTTESINAIKKLIGKKDIEPYKQEVKCIFIERTEGDSENKFSNMSGSLIRRYAILGKMPQLYDVYDGLLSKDQVNELVDLIKIGVNYQDSLSSPESTSPKSPKTRKRSLSSSSLSSSSSSPSSSKRPKKGGTKKKRVKRKSKRVNY